MRRIRHEVLPSSMMSPALLSTAKSSSTVPTTISESAVDTRNQIASNVASSANPTHKAERAHVFIMDPNSFSFI